tara:strand:+ start:3110 stop:3394 length:285 start_codon:yes stop_codon:yes gene_type:complete
MTDEEELKRKRRSKLASQAADLAKTLANASGAKKYRDAGIEAFKGTPVKANDRGVSDSMDITSFHNAYGSRNVDTTGEDMGQMDPEKRKKKYGF